MPTEIFLIGFFIIKILLTILILRFRKLIIAMSKMVDYN